MRRAAPFAAPIAVLSVVVLLAAACGAAAPAGGAGGDGLEALRRALGREAAVGRVVADPGGARLALAAAGGAALATLPDLSGPCAGAPPEDGRWALFAGEPAAALRFDAETASVWALDPARGCLVSTPVFDWTPPGEPLVQLASSYAWEPETPEEGEIVAPDFEPALPAAEVDEQPLPLSDGAPVVLRLGPNGLALELGGVTEPVLLLDGAASADTVEPGACGLTHEAQAEAYRLADGAVLFHVTLTRAARDGDAPDCILPRSTTIEVDEWLRWDPTGGPAVAVRALRHQAWHEDGGGGAELGETTTRLTLHALTTGAVRHDGQAQTEEAHGWDPDENGEPDFYDRVERTWFWAWTYVAPDGTETVLASDEGTSEGEE